MKGSPAPVFYYFKRQIFLQSACFSCTIKKQNNESSRKCRLMELIQTTIKVGLDRPVNVLHITDTHLPLCEKDDAAR